MKKEKIVYICNEINLNSGWGVLNYYTIQEALKKYSEVIVFTLNNANNVTLTNNKNLKVFPLLKSMHDKIHKVFAITMDKIKIKKKIDVNAIDIVHVLVEPLLPLISIFKHSKKIFGIVGTYSGYPFNRGINKNLYVKSLKCIDKIVSISEYTKTRFNNLYNQDIEVVPLGVDYKQFQSVINNIKKEKAFVFVGHIKERKGLIYALMAFSEICKYDKDVVFYIVCAKQEGEYSEKCIQYIKDNNLRKQVKFLGKLNDDELIGVYQKSMCNILTSVNSNEHFEGFGLIHLEANACGIPSLGSKMCGNESAIIEGKTGYLCEQKNIVDIKKKMEKIIYDFEDNNFSFWENNCKMHARNNDWSNYFKTMMERVYI